MKILYRIYNGLMDIFIVSVLIAVFGIYILRFMNIDPYIVMSASMEPAIQTGGLCFVDTEYPYSKIEKNDIIAFQTESDMFVTHRAIDVTEEGIETKGDNNDISDGITTTEHNYLGKTILSVPYLGYILHGIQSVKGKIICISVGISLIIGNMLLTECLEKNKRKEIN